MKENILILFLGLSNISILQAYMNFWRNNACKGFSDYIISPMSPNCYHNPNVGSSIMAATRRDGYPLELHSVITEDGFMLEIYRIPNKEGQPVVLQHGILVNGNIWVNRHNKSLAFQLYQTGKDVWISASRASTYGKNHMKYSPSDDEYWDWSIDELVEHDVGAVLGYIVNATGMAGEIIYIGHSLGSMTSYFYAAAYPEKSVSQLKGIIALAPVSYMDDVAYMKFLAPFSGPFRDILKLLRIRSIFKYDDTLQSLSRGICRFVPHLCYGIMVYIGGRDCGIFPVEDFLLDVGIFPVSMSVDEVTHLAQFYDSKRLQKFDHGALQNLKRYGQEIPPIYNLSKVNVPVFLFHGGNDVSAPRKTVQRLFNELGSAKKEIIEVSQGGKTPYNHLDFEFAINVDTALYPLIFGVIKAHLESRN